MLEISHVRVGYDSTTVIDDLTWAAGPPSALITALLGPSGCGKSTLLRAIAGLEPLAAGSIRFDGHDLAGIPTHRRDFGVVFQDGQLFGGRTVADNVAYGLKMRRWPRADRAARVVEMLDLVGLPGLGNRPATELSGGQAQRVALARALAPRPRLLLLDEPLAALDRRLRDRLAVEIVEILTATNTPAIVVTHDHAEAAVMGDAISVMRGRAIVQTADPDTLWKRPVDDWTATFLGVTTLTDAHVVDGRADTPFGAVALPVTDGAHRIGLRPESVLAHGAGGSPPAGITGPESGSDAVTGSVLTVTDLPAGRRLRVTTPAGPVDAMATDRVVVGDQVTLQLDPDRVALIGS